MSSAHTHTQQKHQQQQQQKQNSQNKRVSRYRVFEGKQEENKGKQNGCQNKV